MGIKKLKNVSKTEMYTVLFKAMIISAVIGINIFSAFAATGLGAAIGGILNKGVIFVRVVAVPVGCFMLVTTILTDVVAGIGQQDVQRGASKCKSIIIGIGAIFLVPVAISGIMSAINSVDGVKTDISTIYTE